MYDELEGNMGRAVKHYIIAARSGYDLSLKAVGKGYKLGYVTKDEYATTLRTHQASQDEMKSTQRANYASLVEQDATVIL